MPQLVKGGKHVFGWSSVGDHGQIVVPPEACAEYRLRESEKVILLPGSKTSGGFGLASKESLRRSPLGALAEVCARLEESRMPEGEILEYKGKAYCWLELRKGGVTVSPRTLQTYGTRIGDKLLVIRGSGLAIGFAARGPIVQEAKKHGDLNVFDAETGDAQRS
jgi:bifunctional DNA-binding transcriptional regulator/antitoxin component of YhaV-PrlF toxin-antitoxin module